MSLREKTYHQFKEHEAYTNFELSLSEFNIFNT